MQDSTFIGLDVHKATISVAVAEGVRGGEVRHLGTIPHRADHIRKLVEKLGAGGHKLHFCYEAGPCGYGLHRQLVELGQDCIVVAPSLIPVKTGDRVKTDRRDAVMLAKMHRAGELTAVWVPDAAHEAMRDLVRARATAMRVTGKARQHLQGFLLRHGRIYPGKKGWTVAYRRWLTTVRFGHRAQQIVFQDYVDAVAEAEARVARLTVIVPMQPTALDAEIGSEALALIREEEEALGRTIRHAVVLTKTSAAVKSRVQRDLEEQLRGAGIDLIEPSLVARAAFSEIFAYGGDLTAMMKDPDMVTGGKVDKALENAKDFTEAVYERLK